MTIIHAASVGSDQCGAEGHSLRGAAPLAADVAEVTAMANSQVRDLADAVAARGVILAELKRLRDEAAAASERHDMIVQRRAVHPPAWGDWLSAPWAPTAEA